jgi:hypothetical protein
MTQDLDWVQTLVVPFSMCVTLINVLLLLHQENEDGNDGAYLVEFV